MICTRCKQDIEEDSVYCIFCGQKVIDNSTIIETGNTRDVSNKDNILPRSFKEFVDGRTFGLGWFVFWRTNIILGLILIVMAVILALVPFTTNRITFVLIRSAGLVLNVVVLEYVAKYAARKKYGFTIKKFIGWAIFWRMGLIMVSTIMSIGVLLALLIPLFARIASGKIMPEIVMEIIKLTSIGAFVLFVIYLGIYLYGKITDIIIRKNGITNNDTAVMKEKVEQWIYAK